MDEEFDWFVGIDWGSESHEVCLVDPRGRKVGGKSFEHSGAGLTQLVDWIATVTSMAVGTRVAVVVELVRGALVATLVERGYRVYECNPKQTDRFRDRVSVAGAKDDRLDAFVLAEAGRKDRELLREVPTEGERVVALRELARLHTQLTSDEVRLTNRLREQLHRYYPQMLAFGEDVAERWRLELWEMAPTPDDVANLRPAGVRALLGRHRIRRVNAQQVLDALRAPKLHVARGVTEAASLHVRTLVPQVRLVRDQLRSIDRQLDTALESFAAEPADAEATDAEATDAETKAEVDPGQKSEQRDVTILRELPGAGRFVIATLLAEAWPALRERDYHRLRAISGVAPVTQQSGKQKSGNRGRQGARPRVSMRRACNARLREALFHWAVNAARHDPRWRARAAALRARGFSTGHIYRVIGDQLLRVLCACLRDGTPYEAERHAARAA